MCGIAGRVHFEGHNREEEKRRVRRMLDVIRYRGPDGDGIWADNRAVLGHVRLAIIDLASGQQPMSIADGKLLITFNGEIYNFRELRETLRRKGHVFQTNSDTECILHGYREWGPDVTRHLSGMFAFGIWDADRQSLFLARDRFGKKPLYYRKSQNGVSFASEIKALLSADRSSPNLLPRSVDCYFSFGYVPAPETIYEGIYKLEPGTSMSFSASQESTHRYWNLSWRPDTDLTESEALDELDDLMRQAVRSRLISEVPLGAFLSGGIDSSLVVAYMAEVGEERPKTCSIGFDDPEFNELENAAVVARHFGCDHRSYVIRPDTTAVLPKIARHFDEPMADSSALPTWYVCEMARQSVTVALSGDGGDESFGGYTFRYLPHIVEARIRSFLPTVLRSTVLSSLAAVWPSSRKLPAQLRLKSYLENLSVNDSEAFHRDLVWLRPENRLRLYSQDFLEQLMGFTPQEVSHSRYSSTDATDALSRAQAADIRLYMTDDVLVKVDRMSMAHSLEVRSPLLDHRIVEFAARLPRDLKVSGRQGKVLLRRLAERKLPAEIVNLPKRGFSIPAEKWFRKELKVPFEDLVFCSQQSRLSEFLSEAVVRGMWKAHQEGRADHHVFLWSLLMFRLWEQENRCLAG